MIQFHGTPLGGQENIIYPAFVDRNFLVSIVKPTQLAKIQRYAKSYIIDNGAFSHWKKGKGEVDIEKYKDFINSVHSDEKYMWNFIPDTIDGGMQRNDSLIETWLREYGEFKSVPIWHYHEDLQRLLALSQAFPVVAIGSSGKYVTIGTPIWHERTKEIFSFYEENIGFSVKLHGLRMLHKSIFVKYPYYSGDSTNVARNGRTYKVTRGYTCLVEATIDMMKGIEAYRSTYPYGDM